MCWERMARTRPFDDFVVTVRITGRYVALVLSGYSTENIFKKTILTDFPGNFSKIISAINLKNKFYPYQTASYLHHGLNLLYHCFDLILTREKDQNILTANKSFYR